MRSQHHNVEDWIAVLGTHQRELEKFLIQSLNLSSWNKVKPFVGNLYRQNKRRKQPKKGANSGHAQVNAQQTRKNNTHTSTPQTAKPINLTWLISQIQRLRIKPSVNWGALALAVFTWWLFSGEEETDRQAYEPETVETEQSIDRLNRLDRERSEIFSHLH